MVTSIVLHLHNGHAVLQLVTALAGLTFTRRLMCELDVYECLLFFPLAAQGSSTGFDGL